MAQAHSGMDITQQEYDDFVATIANVLAKSGVPQETINTCFAPPLDEPSLRAQIIGQ